LNAKHSLPQPRIGIRLLQLDRRSLGEKKCGVDIIKRLLAQGLNEWKERIGERCRNAGLFDPG
jgi:hypothetical protein